MFVYFLFIAKNNAIFQNYLNTLKAPGASSYKLKKYSWLEKLVHYNSVHINKCRLSVVNKGWLNQRNLSILQNFPRKAGIHIRSKRKDCIRLLFLFRSWRNGNFAVLINSDLQQEVQNQPVWRKLLDWRNSKSRVHTRMPWKIIESWDIFVLKKWQQDICYIIMCSLRCQRTYHYG